MLLSPHENGAYQCFNSIVLLGDVHDLYFTICVFVCSACSFSFEDGSVILLSHSFLKDCPTIHASE